MRKACLTLPGARAASDDDTQGQALPTGDSRMQGLDMVEVYGCNAGHEAVLRSQSVLLYQLCPPGGARWSQGSLRRGEREVVGAERTPHALQNNTGVTCKGTRHMRYCAALHLPFGIYMPRPVSFSGCLELTLCWLHLCCCVQDCFSECSPLRRHLCDPLTPETLAALRLL